MSGQAFPFQRCPVCVFCTSACVLSVCSIVHSLLLPVSPPSLSASLCWTPQVPTPNFFDSTHCPAPPPQMHPALLVVFLFCLRRAREIASSLARARPCGRGCSHKSPVSKKTPSPLLPFLSSTHVNAHKGVPAPLSPPKPLPASPPSSLCSPPLSLSLFSLSRPWPLLPPCFFCLLSW